MQSFSISESNPAFRRARAVSGLDGATLVTQMLELGAVAVEMKARHPKKWAAAVARAQKHAEPSAAAAKVIAAQAAEISAQRKAAKEPAAKARAKAA